MKKIYNFFLVLALPLAFLFFSSEMMYPTGSPGGKTGSPGDNGANCTDCHSGTPTSQEGWIFSPELMVLGYSPNQTYNILVVGYDENATKYGFEATAEDANGNKVGSFNADIFGLTQTINNSKAITHTLAGTTPLTDSAFWLFTWVSPPSTVGPVTFYAAVNAANGDGTNNGDHINLTQFTASPATGIFTGSEMHWMGIYPNPSAGLINLEMAETEKGERIDIMNLHGQVVYTQVLVNDRNTIDLSHLDKGIYLARVGDRCQRLILQ